MALFFCGRPVRPAFLRLAACQSPEESWRECHLHARNLLGEGGWREALTFAFELSKKENLCRVFEVGRFRDVHSIIGFLQRRIGGAGGIPAPIIPCDMLQTHRVSASRKTWDKSESPSPTDPEPTPLPSFLGGDRGDLHWFIEFYRSKVLMEGGIGDSEESMWGFGVLDLFFRLGAWAFIRKGRDDPPPRPAGLRRGADGHSARSVAARPPVLLDLR